MLRQQYIDMKKSALPSRDSFDNNGGTEHFQLSEGACRCGNHNYHLWLVMDNLESVRSNLGHPIHNAAQRGSAKNGAHIYGPAADVGVSDWDDNGATDAGQDGLDDDWETLRDAALAAGASVEPYRLSGSGYVHMEWYKINSGIEL